MSMPWHHNDFAALAGISLSLFISHQVSSLLAIMEPMIFVYLFTIKGYDMTVTIEFFPHIIILEDSSPESTDDEFEDIDTFLNL